MKLMVYLNLVLALALSGIVAAEFASILQARNAARADSRATWRAVICTIEVDSLKRPISDKQKQTVVKFWDELLIEKVHSQPC